MALYPISGRERDVTGLFKAHSTDLTSAEGGKVGLLTNEGNDLTVATHAGTADAYEGLVGLLDEQEDSTEATMLGQALFANKTPTVLGPASHLASGRVTLWMESGMFLTDTYDLETTDGEADIAPGTALTATAGTLGDKSGGQSRCTFMKMVNDSRDLFASTVSPAPQSGMFAKTPSILIHQK